MVNYQLNKYFKLLLSYKNRKMNYRLIRFRPQGEISIVLPENNDFKFCFYLYKKGSGQKAECLIFTSLFATLKGVRS